MGFFIPIIASGWSILFLAAVIPPIVLMIYIYQQDKIEKEPPAMIAKLFVYGALTTIAAGILEGVLQSLLNAVWPGGSGILYRLILYFCIVGIVEEGVKHFALRKGSWFSPEFNYRFDAIVYSVAVTLGFAAAENVGYVFSYGLANALVRAVTSIPGHCIFGIYMGYYYGMSKYAADRGEIRRAKSYQRLSLLIPILLHGFYDFCATGNSGFFTFLFFAYIIILDIVAFTSVHRFAKNDEPV